MLFNHNKLRSHRDRVADIIHNNHCLHYAYSDIIARLSMIDKNFKCILDLGCRTGLLSHDVIKKYPDAEVIASDISHKMLQRVNCDIRLLINPENIDFAERSFDLIIFCCGMHWINDMQLFLQKIYTYLRDDGIFIANFVGGKSLHKLRHKLVAIEVVLNLAHTAHISPFIQFEHVVPLLQQAGFQDIIVDCERIQLEYTSVLNLLWEIKNLGESNALVKMTNYAIPKKMLQVLQDDSAPITDQINLISLVAGKNKHTIRLVN